MEQLLNDFKNAILYAAYDVDINAAVSLLKS